MGKGKTSAAKVVILLGSPRRKGNSATLAEKVAAGAKAAGASVESFYLHGMNIKPCSACDACRGDIDTNCVIQDDMQILYPKLRAADAIVIASPIYWFTVSAQTKLFMDRCYALGGPAGAGYAFKGKRIGIVLTYEDTDPFTSGAVNALRMFQDGFDYVEAKIVGMVYGRAGKAGAIKSNRSLLREARELGKQLAAP
jgi:multimeric flavodoxin WrbA